MQSLIRLVASISLAATALRAAAGGDLFLEPPPRSPDTAAWPDSNTVARARPDTTWSRRLRSPSELGRVLPGARIGLALRDGGRLTGYFQGFAELPASSYPWLFDRARELGYRGPDHGDTLTFETVNHERLTGRFEGIWDLSLRVRTSGDSLALPRAIRELESVSSGRSTWSADTLQAWAAAGRLPNLRSVTLASDATTSLPPLPIQVPFVEVTGFADVDAPNARTAWSSFNLVAPAAIVATTLVTATKIYIIGEEK